jgi:hypothetical protein
MRRHILGFLAAMLLVGAAFFRFYPPPESMLQLDAFCCRLGALFAAWWLAWPDLARLPGWIMATMPVLAIVVVRWPKLLFLVIPAMLVIAILKPRSGRPK